MIIERAHSFRQWLAGRLRGTRWANQNIPEHKIDRVAKALGLDPELLLEVRAEVKATRAKLGLATADGKRGFAPGRQYYQIDIPMPGAIIELWRKECVFRQVQGSVLLRSLIHDYLTHVREPLPMVEWAYQNRCYSVDWKRPERERSTLPHGANRALTLRAQNVGTRAICIVRALMMETLMGLHRDVLFVEARSMFDDENRYFEAARASA